MKTQRRSRHTFLNALNREVRAVRREWAGLFCPPGLMVGLVSERLAAKERASRVERAPFFSGARVERVSGGYYINGEPTFHAKRRRQ